MGRTARLGGNAEVSHGAVALQLLVDGIRRGFGRGFTLLCHAYLCRLAGLWFDQCDPFLFLRRCSWFGGNLSTRRFLWWSSFVALNALAQGVHQVDDFASCRRGLIVRNRSMLDFGVDQRA